MTLSCALPCFLADAGGVTALEAIVDVRTPMSFGQMVGVFE